MEVTPESGTHVRRDIYSVSRLNREVRALLERGFGSLWLEAEISNFSRPSSGHWYFTLKDSQAQVRCAMFRQRNMLCAFTARDGQKVLVRARIGLYEPRGEYQLIVDHMEDAGLGALRRKFEELSARLAAEGLFAPERKRPLPALPRRIGVLTSPSGAAVRDILHVLARRFPAVAVLIHPVSVQGTLAPAEIISMLQLAGRRAECDVLILARGGGSLEDLWAFNDEQLALGSRRTGGARCRRVVGRVLEPRNAPCTLHPAAARRAARKAQAARQARRSREPVGALRPRHSAVG
jgi:exodeoxyribonuclease VII large subunit